MKSLRDAASIVLTRRSHAAGDGRGVAAVRRHFAALAVHVVRPNPVGERVVRAVLVAPLWRSLEDAVDGHEVFATARKTRVRVEDVAALVAIEHVVAGDIL